MLLDSSTILWYMTFIMVSTPYKIQSCRARIRRVSGWGKDLKLQSDSPDVEDLRERIASACRVLGELDITASVYGHVSGRLPGSDRIFIRARGIAESGVRYTSKADVIEVGLDGRRIAACDDGFSVPVEVFIHTEIYRERPDVFAVIHMHPASAVLVTACDIPLEPIIGAYDPFGLALIMSGVPTFQRSILINSPELGLSLAEVLGSSSACLMRGHGITTAANSVEEAALIAIQLNTVATLNCQARAIGAPKAIRGDDQDRFRAMFEDYRLGNPVSGPGVAPKSDAALWRYYLRMAHVQH